RAGRQLLHCSLSPRVTQHPMSSAMLGYALRANPTYIYISLPQVRRLRLDGFGHVAHRLAGVLGGGRLHQHDPALLGCRRHVLDAARHDMEIALAQRDVVTVAIADDERALAYEKELVLIRVGMPHELALAPGASSGFPRASGTCRGPTSSGRDSGT